VQLHHPVREIDDRHRQRVCQVLWQILDALVDEGHQGGELVRGDPRAGLQDRHHALT